MARHALTHSPCCLHAVLPQQRGAGALGAPVLEGYPPSGAGGRVAEGVCTPPELRGLRAFLGKRLPGRGHGGRRRSSWWGIARRSVLKGSAGGVRPEAPCPMRTLTQPTGSKHQGTKASPLSGSWPIVC